MDFLRSHRPPGLWFKGLSTSFSPPLVLSAQTNRQGRLLLPQTQHTERISIPGPTNVCTEASGLTPLRLLLHQFLTGLGQFGTFLGGETGHP